MEKLFVREEGRSYAEPNPPPGYVVIGTHRTGGGGHRWYAYATINACPPEELVKFFQENPRLFGGGQPYFKIEGRRLTIYTLTPGSWIGTRGRWIKGIEKSLLPGYSVEVRELAFFHATRSIGLVPIGVRFIATAFKEKLSLIFAERDNFLRKFEVEAGKKYLSRESVISRDNSHNYLYDIVAFLPKEKEWLETSIRRILEADKSAWEKVNELTKQGEEIQKNYREWCYFSSALDAYLIFQNTEWFNWAIDKAKILKKILGKGVGIYSDSIYLGGSCSYDPESEGSKRDKKMLADIEAGIKEKDFVIVQINPGQYEMRKK